MDREMLTIAIVFFAVIIIGFVEALNRHKELIKEIKFVGEYLDKFNQFVETYESNFDSGLYYWLTKNALKIQATLGYFGVADFQQPFSNTIHINHQIILNTLPTMRTGRAQDTEINGSQEALIRYMGLLEGIFESSKNNLKNPLKWIQLGAQYLISLPVRLLYWFGLINKSSLNKIMNNYLFKLFSFIAIMLGIISSLITILQYLDII